MPFWSKDSVKGIITGEISSSQKAKREGAAFLRKVCGRCRYLANNRYGLIEEDEGFVGVSKRVPYIECPGIGQPEARCNNI